MDIKQWLGEDNELGLKIWHNKYQHGDESFEEWLDRVSGGSKLVAQLIKDKKFLFGGRILANRGVLDRKLTYSNCYVLEPVEDSIEGIYGTAGKLARTFSYGGGVGIDISNLRPKGSPVNNAAKTTSGAVSFMETFSGVSEVIGQEGRRGALMISMDVNHQDIEDFIDAKKNTNKLEGCNISVRMNDEFMNELTKSTMDSKEVHLFKKLCYNNWDYAEPGILYWDTIKNYNLLSEYIKNGEFEYAGVNPCITGDTLIQTIEGKVAIKDLVGTQPYVYCMDDEGKLIVKQASKVWMTRKNAQLVEIDFNRGKLVCTPDHKIYTRNRGWVEAKDLVSGDKLNGLGISKGNEIDEYVKLSTDSKSYPHHRFIMNQMGHDIEGKDVHHIDDNHLNNVYSNLEVLSHSEHSKLTNIGHECYCNRCPKTGVFIPHDEHKRKNKTPSVNIENTGKNFTVKSVTELTYVEDVYDMTVPDVHNFIANDIVIHNCAEEPLPAGGSCLLGAINLAAFVEHDGAFNFPVFKTAVRIAIQALNDVLDEGLDLHPLEEQRKTVREWRQIGLGIMGFADMLIKKKIRYGSPESIELIHKIGNAMVDSGLRESAFISSLTKPFKEYDKEHILNSTFYKSHKDSGALCNTTVDYVQKHGLRNSQLFTIAPTGSISTMLGVSGGVEPIFSPYFTRTTKSLEGKDVTYTVTVPVIEQALKGAYEPGKPMPEFITWAEILDPFERVKVQGAWQQHIDASISSTVNLHHDVTPTLVEALYLAAWKEGCKGLTIYRDGCARTPILSTKKEEQEEQVEQPTQETIPGWGHRADIAPDTFYIKRKLITGCGKLKLFIGWSPSKQRIQDVYIVRSGKGGCEKNIQANCILISEILRLGGGLDQVKRAFSGIGLCPSFSGAKAKNIMVSPGGHCPGAIVKAIEDFLEEMNTNNNNYEMCVPTVSDLKVETKSKVVEYEMDTKHKCPECGSPIASSGGCNICLNCGYSKCD